MDHDTKADLTPRGPFILKYDKEHGVPLGITCPHHKEPVTQCDECPFQVSISESFSSPEQINLYTQVAVTISQQFRLMVIKGNPDHVCKKGNPACEAVKAE